MYWGVKKNIFEIYFLISNRFNFCEKISPLFILLFYFLFPVFLFAQSDTLIIDTSLPLVETTLQIDDTIKNNTVQSKFLTQPKSQNHSPKKAAIYSALLPGLGQAYNKKYWKIPIVYVGFAGIGFWLGSNINDNRTFKKAFRYRVDNNPNTIDNFVGRFSDDDLRILKNDARRNRDLSYIILLLWYGINIIDATVDAHLFHFDISDNLSLHVHPKLEFYTQKANFAGLQIGLDF